MVIIVILLLNGNLSFSRHLIMSQHAFNRILQACNGREKEVHLHTSSLECHY